MTRLFPAALLMIACGAESQGSDVGRAGGDGAANGGAADGGGEAGGAADGGGDDGGAAAGGGDDGAGAGGAADGEAGGGGGDAGGEQGEDVVLSGTFAVRAEVKATLIIPLTSTQFFLMEFEDAGDGKVKQTTTNCRNDLPSVEGIAEMVLPQAVLDLLQSRPSVVTGDFVEGNKYSPPRQSFSLGVDFEGRDPFTAPLPTEGDLTFALDEDGDGNPGVTVDVEALLCDKTQQLYAAFRTIVELEGTIESEDLITGVVSPQLDQAVLGVSDSCLDAAKALSPTVADGSTFKAIRIDPGVGTVTCDQMLEDVETLFPSED